MVLVDRLGNGDSDGKLREGSNAIEALIDSARERYFAASGASPRGLAHIHFVASHPRYRRRRLVERLVAAVTDAARDAGYDALLVEASGIRSHSLFRDRSGFSEQVTVRYADFEYGGQKPFAAIADHIGLCVMSLDLGSPARK